MGDRDGPHHRGGHHKRHDLRAVVLLERAAAPCARGDTGRTGRMVPHGPAGRKGELSVTHGTLAEQYCERVGWLRAGAGSGYPEPRIHGAHDPGMKTRVAVK